MRQKRLLTGIFSLLLGLVAAPYIVVWLSGHVYGTFDLSHITIAIEDLYARYQAAGEIPVWTPEFQGGFPMMANGFQSFWYPPHLLLRSFLPGVWVANISLLLHAWLAAAGMWLLLRAHKLSAAAAAAGSLLFAAGGYFVGHVTLPHLFFPAAWLPLVLWQWLAFWQRPGWRRAIVCAVLIAAQVFAGHVQMFLYTALLLLIAGLVSVGRRRVWNKQLGWVLVVPILVFILTAVHVLPIQELLPLSKRGQAVVNEEAFSVSYPVWQSLTWVQADIFGTQESYAGAKNEPELLLFFGVTGVILGIMGAVTPETRRRALGLIAGALIIMGFTLGAGEYSPVYRWLHGLPTFLAGVANPGRALILTHLGWCILVGFGAEAMQRATRRAVAAKMTGALLSIGIVGWVIWQRLPTAAQAIAAQHMRIEWLLLSGAAMLASTMLPRSWRTGVVVGLVTVEVVMGGWGINPSVAASSLIGPPRIATALTALGRAPRIFSSTALELPTSDRFDVAIGPRLNTVRSVRQTVTSLRDGWRGVRVGLAWPDERRQRAQILMKIYTISGHLLRQQSIDAVLLPAGQLVELRFEPLLDSANQPYTIIFSSTARGEPEPHVLMYPNSEADFNPTGNLQECVRDSCQMVKAADFTSADVAFTLVYNDDLVTPEREALVPIFGEGFGYWMVRGHMQMQLKTVQQYLYALGERANFMPEALVEQRSLLDRLSVGWLIALWPEHRFLSGMPGVSLVGSAPVRDTYVRAYRNEQAWPRVHVAPHIQLANTADEAREQLVRGAVPPDAIVVVAHELPAGIGTAPAQVRIENDETQTMRIAVASQSTQMLVVRDVVFPGWHAFIDDMPTSILTVDSLWRGVIVPAGQHTVSFLYQPTPYRAGIFLSGVGWLGVLSLGLYEIRRVLATRS